MDIKEKLEDIYIDLSEVYGKMDEASNKKIEETMTLIAEILENLEEEV